MMKNFRIAAAVCALVLGCSSLSQAQSQFQNQGGAAQGLQSLATSMGGTQGNNCNPKKDNYNDCMNCIAMGGSTCDTVPKGFFPQPGTGMPEF